MSNPPGAHNASSGQQAPFPRLPAEIRNDIYAYVLCPDNGLQYPRDKAINRIKHVCGQTRSEAAWLELKLNPDIEFVGKLKCGTATERVLAFSKVVPREYHRWLQAVRLRNEGCILYPKQPVAEFEETLLELTTLCEQNSQLNVRYQLLSIPALQLPADERPFAVVLIGCLLLFLFRQQVPDATQFPEIPIHESFETYARELGSLTLLRDGSPAVKAVRKRIRIYLPSDHVDPDPFRPGVVYGHSTRKAQARGHLPIWEALIRKWMREGL